MTRLELIRHLQHQLRQGGLPEQEARWLVAHASHLDHKTLATRLFEPVAADVLEAAEAMLRLRLGGYPLQLLLGETEFYGLRLKVEQGILVPRPETEGLVERALACVAKQPGPNVLDVGTGSGAVALAVRYSRPDSKVWATDTNPKAIALAQENARRTGLDITLINRPYTADLEGLDLVVSNPPYLRDEYRREAPPELSYEDDRALYSGSEGLDMARELLPQAWAALKPGGWLALELSPDNVYILLGEATQAGWQHARVHRDLAQVPRYLVAQKPGPAESDEPIPPDEAIVVGDE